MVELWEIPLPHPRLLVGMGERVGYFRGMCNGNMARVDYKRLMEGGSAGRMGRMCRFFMECIKGVVGNLKRIWRKGRE